jgi:lipopolysaccharide transport system ATP-binding protein
MSRTVIKVEGLSKEYVIGGRERSGDTFSEMLVSAAAAPFRRFRRLGGRAPVEERIWALKDMSFEVKEGEVVGIIGGNGAGKSTLLKILSRITEPTEGRAEVHGRVASLLEVGTGFHPELTGRENVYLNGAILGMSRAEIDKKFDEIVDFSGVDKFLDTPVKRYSSGMSVRLAFAVAAHLEPEILLLDEVLAVGDIEFQKKCLGKMSDVARGGRTVLFVSHNIGAVNSLCVTGILLSEGRLLVQGRIREVTRQYHSRLGTFNTEVNFPPRTDAPSITKITIDHESLARGDILLSISFESPFPLCPPVPGILLSTAFGGAVFGSNPRFHQTGYPSTASARGTVRLEVRNIPIAPGNYLLSAWLGDWHRDYDVKRDALRFEFLVSKSVTLRPGPSWAGSLEWPAQWYLNEQ